MNIKSIVVGEFLTVCYMISAEDFAAVIDPPKFTPTVREFAENNMDKETKLILLTHCHYDHMGGAEELRELWGAPILIGEHDGEGLTDPYINLSGRYSSTPISFKADRLLCEGDVIKLGDEELRVMHTPGHTIGSVCYVSDKVIFSGDTLFKLTAGRCDFPTGDMGILKDSLLRLKNLEGDCRVLPGHGDETTLSAERIKNRFMRLL